MGDMATCLHYTHCYVLDKQCPGKSRASSNTLRSMGSPLTQPPCVLSGPSATPCCRNVEQYPEAEQTPGILAVRLDAPVYFANVQRFQDVLSSYEKESAAYARKNGVSGVKFLILDLTPVSHMDSMGAHMIEDLYNELKDKGTQLLLSNPSPQVVRILNRAGVTEKLKREWIFVRVHDAVQHCKGLLEVESKDVDVTDRGDQV